MRAAVAYLSHLTRVSGAHDAGRTWEANTMKTHPPLSKATGLIAAIFFCTVPAWAQPLEETFEAPLQPGATTEPDEDEPSTPPERGATYGRLRHFEGGISLKREGETAGGEEQLAVNSPLIPGDQVWTGEDGRLEIQLAEGSILRLDRNSRLSLLNLADNEAAFDNTTLIRLMNGSLYVRADTFDPRKRRFQIDTPAGSVFLLSGGVFRVDVTPDGISTVASYRGVAEVLGEDISVMAHSGERVTAEPGNRPAEARAFNTLRRDPFDVWVENQDDANAGAESAQGVKPQVPEPVAPYVSELSRYGAWKNDDQYGWIWIPDARDNDWRPYFYGQWSSTPIGMTWVSYDPWGWAPYHYGRWSWTTGVGWFWVPGFAYSGAYVSWAIGPTFYGWVPLGYYDYPVFFRHNYYPWVYVSHRHLYDPFVHRRAYSWSDVSKYKLGDRSVILRRAPRLRPGYRPETAGPATYRRVISNPRLVQPKLANGEPTRAPFKLNDQRTYRRSLARQALAERKDLGRGPVAVPRNAAPSRPFTPSGVSQRLSPRPPAAEDRAPGSVRIRPISATVSPGVPVRRISPATGRPLAPPVRIVPRAVPMEDRSNVRGIGSGAPGTGVVRRVPGSASTGTARIERPPARTTPPAVHPRVAPGRSGSGRGSYVMPSHPSRGAPRTTAAPAPMPSPRPAPSSKGGGSSHAKGGGGKKGGKD